MISVGGKANTFKGSGREYRSTSNNIMEHFHEEESDGSVVDFVELSSDECRL